MKYIKMLGLLAVAAAALMAYGGTASADYLKGSTSGGVYTGNIAATSEGSTYLTGAWSAVKCEESFVEGTVTDHGTKKAVEGNVKTLTFSKCNYTVTVIQEGQLVASKITTGATVTSKNAIVDVHTSIGRCRFATGSGVHIGQLTDSHKTSGTATFDIDNSKIPVTEGNFFCGSTGEWEGSYKVNTPDALYVEAS